MTIPTLSIGRVLALLVLVGAFVLALIGRADSFADLILIGLLALAVIVG